MHQKILVIIASLICSLLSIYAQNKNLVWKEDFGVAADSVRMDFADPEHTMPGHFCQLDTSVSVQDGSYAIMNSTAYAFEANPSQRYFNLGRDHTGNKDGAMLVVNTMGSMVGEVIYEQKIDFPLCSANKYHISMFTASITSFTCQQASLKLIVLGDGTDELNSIETKDIPWWDLVSGTYDDPKSIRQWTEYGFDFNSEGYKTITIQIINEAKCIVNDVERDPKTLESWESCGAGNDFVLDDISLYRYDQDEVPEAEVASTTITQEAQLNSNCIYTSSYNIPSSVLEAWQKIYPSIYILWQSSPNGYEWTNMTDKSGINKREMETEVDATQSTRYRVIITGGMTESEAENVALQIAANGGPDDGCYKFAISNTLASGKLQADCSFNRNLKKIWAEDFGVVDSFSIKGYDGVGSSMKLYNPSEGEEFDASHYVVTSDADTSIYVPNSWNKYPENNAKGIAHSSNDAYLYLRFGASSSSKKDILLDKTISGPFCNCKSLLFSFNEINTSGWGTIKIKAQIINDNGDILGEESFTHNGGNDALTWVQHIIPFDVEKNYTGNIHIQLINEGQEEYARMGIDDMVIAVCGDLTPGDPIIGIDNTSQTYLTGFDCNDEPPHTITSFSTAEWEATYPSFGYAWQISKDGGNSWSYLSADKILSHENDGEGIIEYRAIFAETLSDAIEIASKGAPSDPCIIYSYSNVVGLNCHPSGCKKPMYKIDGDTVMEICTNEETPIIISTVQQNSVNVDERQWYSKLYNESSWKELPGETNETLTITSYPADSTDYLFIARKDTCYSDSVLFRLNIHTPIVIEEIPDTLLCAGSDITYKPILKSGHPIYYVWNDIPSTEKQLTIEDVSDNQTITFYANDKVCESQKQTFKIEVEEQLDYDVTIDHQTVCAGNPVVLTATTSSSTGTVTETWSKNSVTFSTTASTTDYPTENTTYEFRAKGKVCPEFSKTFDVTVETSSELSISTAQTKVCQGETITLSAEYGDATSLEWQYSTDNVDFTTFSTELTSTQTFPIKQYEHYYFKLKTTGTGACPTIFSPTVSVDVDFSLNIEWGTIPTLCAGTEISFTFTGLDEQEVQNHTYSWKKDGVEFDTNLETTIFLEKSADYSITVSNGACPDLTHTYTINVQQPVELALNVDKEKICSGESIEFTADYGTATSLVWVAVDLSDDSGRKEFSSELTSKLTNTPSHSTMYWIEYPGDDVCPNTIYSDFIEVIVEEPIEFSINEVPSILCAGTEINLSAIQTKGSYTEGVWTKNGDTLSHDFQTTDIPTDNTLYEFTIQGDVCPDVHQTVSVEVEKASDLTLSTPNTKICPNTSIILSASYGDSNTLEWESSSDGVNYTVFDNELKTSLEVSPETNTYYRLKTKGSYCPQIFSDPLFVEVEEKILAELTTNDDQFICYGSEIQLEAKQYSGKNNTIQWTKNGVLFAENTLTIHDTPQEEESEYKLTIGNACETLLLSNYVWVERQPKIALSIEKEGICNDGDITLYVEAEDCNGLSWQRKYDYETDYHEITSFMGNSYTDKISEPATYRIVSKYNEACPTAYSEEKHVTVEKKGEIILPSENLTICPNANAEIKLIHNGIKENQFLYKTTPEAALTTQWSTGRVNLSLAPSETTIIEVAVEHKYCETEWQKLTVNIDETPTIEISSDKDEICKGESVTLSSSYALANTLTWYATINGQQQIIGNSVGEISYAPVETTSFSLIGSTMYNCPTTEESITINVNQPISFTIDDQDICESDSTELKIKNLSNYTSITWKDPEDGIIATDVTQLPISPEATTNYTLHIENGVCTADTTIKVTIVTTPSIVAHEEISNKTYKLTYETDNYPVYFDYGDGRGKTTADIIENVLYGKTYNISISNEYGCSSTYKMETPLYDIYIPEYFHPELGNWRINNLERYGKCNVKIFDRFGKQLAEWNESDTEGWDGTYNGEKLPSTDYWYVVSIGELDIVYSGHFTLIR